MCELRISEQREWYLSRRSSRKTGIYLASKVLANDSEVVESDMCEVWRAQAPTAKTPFSVARFHSSTLMWPFGDNSIPATSAPMLSVFGMRPVAQRMCDPSISSVSLFPCIPRRLFRHAYRRLMKARSIMKTTPSSPEYPLRNSQHPHPRASICVRYVRLRYFCSKTSYGLGKLQANVSTTDDYRMIRNFFNVQHLNMNKRLRRFSVQAHGDLRL